MEINVPEPIEVTVENPPAIDVTVDPPQEIVAEVTEGDTVVVEVSEGPPGIPPGGTTGQYLAKKSDQSYDVEWKAGGGGTGEAAWGDISGDITAQTDLQTALDAKADNDDLAGKADVNHSHSVEEVIGLTNALAQKQPVGDYATNDDLAGKVDDDDPRLSDSRDPNAHTHPVADIDATGTPSSDTYLRGDGTWATPATGGTGASNWGELGGDIADQTDLQQALDAKQDAGDYATNSDLTNGLAGKADATHEHAISDVTGLQTELDGKQDAGDYATNSDLTTGLAGKANSAHSHASTDITDFNTAVDARIENVVGAAPEALDTLAEIAESLNNDEDFAGTMTTQLAGKADAAHGHEIADVTGLQSALDGKQTAGDYVTGTELTNALSDKVDDTDPRLSDTRDPNAHSHDISDLNVTGTPSVSTYLRGDGTWAEVEGGGSGNIVWGNVTGTLSDQTDLQAALDEKKINNARYWNGTGGEGTWDDRPTLPTGMHAAAYSLTDPLAPPPPDAIVGDTWDRHPDAAGYEQHTHEISDVDGLQDALDAKQDVQPGIVNAKLAGATGDGTTDDTTALQAAIDLAQTQGDILFIPSGTYKVSSSLNITAPLTVQARGATLVQDGTSAMALIEISSSDVEIDGVKAVGPNNGAYISNSYGIRAQGSSAASRLNNIYIHNCEITGFGSAAIRPVFLENFRVDNNYLHDTVYAGIAGWSVSNGSMCYNFIKDIEMPEGTTNSYGIALSQRTTTGPDETYPRCSNVRVSYNHIENVPWEGLDTHSGERIIFTNNNVISCGCGIAVVCVDTNPDRGAPHHCIVANNIIDVGDAEVIRPAISLGGADDGTSAYNVVEYARGCVIANNQIKGYPRPDSSYDGAIRVNNTIGLTITGGVIYEPVVTGIILGHNNIGFNISGVTIVDVFADQTAGTANTAGVRIHDGNNTGHIDGVNIVRGDKVASRSVNRYVLLARGSQTGNDVTIGDIRMQDTEPGYGFSDPDGIFYSRNLATKAGFFRQPGDRRPTIVGVDVETNSAMDLLLKELASTGFIDDQATRI